MLVKCQICGEKIDRDAAYKRITNGGNKYYCSVSEYESEEQKKKQAAEDKEKVYRLVCNILQQNEIINSTLWKEYNVWLKVATAKKIGDYLEENEASLTQNISRLTGPLYNKIRYLSVVIGNQIVDWKPKARVAEVPRVVHNTFELFEPVADKQPIFEKQVLDDVEDDII